MGVDIISKLIVGVYISKEKLLDYLVKNKVGTCLTEKEYDDPNFIKKRHQCFCRDYCWDSKHFPEGINVIQCSPSYDCGFDSYSTYISLTKGSESLSPEELQNLFENKELIETFYKFVKEIDPENNMKICVLSDTHVS